MDKFCSKCGAELKEGANVCLNCGRFIESNAPGLSPLPGSETGGNSRNNRALVVELIGAILFVVGLFSLILSVAYGDVFIPEWSDYYWYYPNTSLSVISILVFCVGLIVSAVSFSSANKEYRVTKNFHVIALPIFLLVSNFLMVVASFATYANSLL